MDCLEANQKLEPLRREFNVIFYRWAETDLAREVNSGFHWVKKVKSNRAFHYLEFLLGLPPHERLDAAVALLRNSIVHRKARTQLGLQLTERELRYAQEFDKRFYPIAQLSEREKLLPEEYLPEQFEIDRDALELMLEQRLSAAFGQRSSSNRACTFMQSSEGWFIETSVDVHSIYQVRYGHTIAARNADDLCPVQLREGSISLLAWLGVHPSTNFEFLRNSDLEATVEFIVEVTNHFLSSVPPLLKGFKNTIPANLSLSRTSRSEPRRR